MNYIQLFRIGALGIGAITFLVKGISYVYILVFQKPPFVHLYYRKKKVSKVQRELLKEVKFYQQLPPKEQVNFEHRLAMFIRHYQFVGRNNFKVTNEVKIQIGVVYVMLTFGMRNYLINVFDKIIIYPEAYYSKITKRKHKGEFNYQFKAVVFSWEDFLEGIAIDNDNLHLGIHEFTHALTFYSKTSKDINAKIFYKEFQQITAFFSSEDYITRMKRSGYFRTYAFTNKLEFIAVVMEYFFETPQQLRQQYPILYRKIKKMLNYKKMYTK